MTDDLAALNTVVTQLVVERAYSIPVEASRD
jgi:hypothetical protein